MKSRLTLIFAALVVLLGAMIWLVQDRTSVSAGPALLADRTITAPVVAPAFQVAAAANSSVALTATTESQIKSSPMVQVDTAGQVRYVAREGDTVSKLAIALLGTDTKENREAIIAANPSLRTNVDRVLEGYAYVAVATLMSTDVKPDANVTPVVEKLPAVAIAAAKMKYIALPGDTLGVLAANLLGGDTKVNRDAIVAQNPSLQTDPDHLVAGQTYTIVAKSGLSDDGDSFPPNVPTAQPDADDVTRISAGRTLRYVAQSGDTVSKLAEVLLGSDTPINRDLIINTNPSLKRDPDHLVAGETYWIPVPAAAAGK